MPMVLLRPETTMDPFTPKWWDPEEEFVKFVV